MDPNYEKYLEFLRNDPIQGRLFSLPFTDFYTPLVSGTSGGIYYGPPMALYLGGRMDLAGKAMMFPFSFTLLNLAQKGDYKSIENLFSLLNIQYVYYNSDDAIVKNFPDWPYRDDVRQMFPPYKEVLTKFISNLHLKERKNFGPNCHLYGVDKNSFLPLFYTPKKIDISIKKEDFVFFEGTFAIQRPFWQNKPDYERRTLFLEEGITYPFSKNNTKLQPPSIIFTKINPTKYLVDVKNAVQPFVLVFSNTFHSQWKLFLSEEGSSEPVIDSYFNGEIQETKPINKLVYKTMFSTWNKNPIADNTHLRANGYANAWYITPKDVGNKTDYTLVVEYTPQRIFYTTFPLSLAGFLFCTIVFVVLLFGRVKNKKIRYD